MSASRVPTERPQSRQHTHGIPRALSIMIPSQDDAPAPLRDPAPGTAGRCLPVPPATCAVPAAAQNTLPFRALCLLFPDLSTETTSILPSRASLNTDRLMVTTSLLPRREVSGCHGCPWCHTALPCHTTSPWWSHPGLRYLPCALACAQHAVDAQQMETKHWRG